jgi:hypothetical protein
MTDRGPPPDRRRRHRRDAATAQTRSIFLIRRNEIQARCNKIQRPSQQKSKPDATRTNWLFLPGFEPCQRVRRYFPPLNFFLALGVAMTQGRFGRIKPTKSKQLLWISLAGLGFAWRYLAAGPNP